MFRIVLRISIFRLVTKNLKIIDMLRRELYSPRRKDHISLLKRPLIRVSRDNPKDQIELLRVGLARVLIRWLISNSKTTRTFL